MSVSVEHLQRLLQELAGKISLEELRVAEYKETVNAIGGRMPLAARPWSAVRLGQIKHLYNLIEEWQLVFLKLTFPDRTFYGQAKFVALELPNGKLIPLVKGQRLPVLELPDGSFIPAKPGAAAPKGAKPVTLPRGRIGDIIEISGVGDVANNYEFKTKNAIVDSAGRASDIHDIETEHFKPKRALNIQTNVERVIQKAGLTLKAKIVVQCKDPIVGVSVIKKIAPDKFPISQVMTYGQIPDRLVNQQPGFIKPTLDTANKRGNIHLKSSKMSRLPQPTQEAVEPTAKPSGRPTFDQRGTTKVSEHGRLVESTSVGGATRFVGTATRFIGRVNLALSPVGVYNLAGELSGEAGAKQAAGEVAAGLNIDDFQVGDEFIVEHGGYEFYIRVEFVRPWPSLPGKKGFAFLRRTPAVV